MYIIYYKVAQLFIGLISLIIAVNFGFLKCQKKFVPWQLFYLMCVETISYFIMVLTDVPLFINDTVPLIRYLTWCATCPPLLNNMIHIVGNDDSDISMQMTMVNIWMIIFGVLSALSIGAMKIVFFVFAAIVYCFMFLWTRRILQNNKKQLTDFKSRKNLLFLFFGFWSVFPILFLIGPEGYGAITGEMSMFLHCLGDLLSKNLCTVIMWKLQRSLKISVSDKQVVPSNVLSTDATKTTVYTSPNTSPISLWLLNSTINKKQLSRTKSMSYLSPSSTTVEP